MSSVLFYFSLQNLTYLSKDTIISYYFYLSSVLLRNVKQFKSDLRGVKTKRGKFILLTSLKLIYGAVSGL